MENKDLENLAFLVKTELNLLCELSDKLGEETVDKRKIKLIGFLESVFDEYANNGKEITWKMN